MILPQPQDAMHKAWLYRILSAICDHRWVADQLAFKGGTSAAMRGYLDRFSVDLDFDLIKPVANMDDFRRELESIFTHLDLSIKDSSSKTPQYFLAYPQFSKMRGIRNTVKIDITHPPPLANVYEKVRLVEIDKIISCQTLETMFANKLVALIDRFECHASIAGRDIYDIHHYFTRGFRYHDAVIKERRGIGNLVEFFDQLIDFINVKVTPTVINQDLNHLLESKKFQVLRKTIKNELLLWPCP